MLVGEQPGDQEDRQGRPFVGPAGRVLDSALQDAGLDRAAMYLTNAVKHFKWTPARETTHPLQTDRQRQAEFDRLVVDLRLAKTLHESGGDPSV